MIPDIRDGLDERSRDCLSQLGDRYVRSSKIARDEQTYEALVRLAQDFRLRYPLVDGRGNFGSVDDDPPADAQYTEVRLAPLGRELPRFPNVMVNGSGTIPPHNLVEVADAVIAVLDDPALDLAGLMEHLPGPDFPSGGVLSGPIRETYETGRGVLRLRGRAHVEDGTIVVTELPCGVAKGGDEGVIREIVECVFGGTLPGINDVQDHSDRRGQRLLIGVERGTDPRAVLDRLYATTSLEIAFPVGRGVPLGSNSKHRGRGAVRGMDRSRLGRLGGRAARPRGRVQGDRQGTGHGESGRSRVDLRRLRPFSTIIARSSWRERGGLSGMSTLG